MAPAQRTSDNTFSGKTQDATTSGEGCLPAFSERIDLKCLASGPDCVKVIGLDGTLCFINEAGLRLMDIDDAASVIGTSWLDLWPADARAVAEQSLRDGRHGKGAHFQGLCPTPKGLPRWWDVVVSPVPNDTGEVKWLLAISRDITRQRAIEASLVESEQRFRALADNIAQLAWMSDASGNAFWYNQRWFEYTGTVFDDMAGWGWKSVIHPDHLHRVTKKITCSFKSGDVWEDTYPLRGADGTYRWFLSRARSIRDEQGRVVLWCGTNTDITEQRAISQRLRQKARLLELSHEAILVWDTHDGILFWNRGCDELYGYEKAEALGRSPLELLKVQQSTADDNIHKRFSKSAIWSDEVLHIAKDGTQVWVESRQELIRIGGRSMILETNRDITDRRRADDLRNLLIGELNHRVKNTLAIVQSIAAQTARNSLTVAQFSDSFNGRLQALSSAHNALTDAHWVGAGLRNLVESQLAVTVGDRHNFDIAGEDLFLSPQIALQFTLVLHELATNALKFGAWSRPEGRVKISWTITNDDGRKVNLTWQEIGGPPVSPPIARGFGMTLIERSSSLPHFKTKTRFHPDGFVCELTADLTNATASGTPYFNPGQTSALLNEARLARTTTRPTNVVSKYRRVLIIEDEPITAMEIDETLSDAGYWTLGTVSSIDEAMTAIAELEFDAAIVDASFSGEPADEIVDALERRRIPVVVIAEIGNKNFPSMRAHVATISKPVRGPALLDALKRATDADQSGAA